MGGVLITGYTLAGCLTARRSLNSSLAQPETPLYSRLCKANYLKQGTEITILVNLIDKETGEREDNSTKSICIIEKDATLSEGGSAQADFKCIIENLKKECCSLRFNSSDDVTGIPDDEVLLDPVITQESIDKKRLIDYSIEENKSPENIPVTFSPQKIEKANCLEDGIFIIKGSLSKAIDSELRFKILFTFPEGITTDCTLKEGITEISCQVDRKIDNSNIAFEQIIIKDGSKEILNSGGISS